MNGLYGFVARLHFELLDKRNKFLAVWAKLNSPRFEARIDEQLIMASPALEPYLRSVGSRVSLC